MKEAVSMDERPMLRTYRQRVQVAVVLDHHIPTHGLYTGQSMGAVAVVWLAPLLSQADHRSNHVHRGGNRRLHTVRGCRQETLRRKDLTDDRLADVLSVCSDGVRWQACTQELMEPVLRISDLGAGNIWVKTTAWSSARVTEHGLTQVGNSMGHCPDMPHRALARTSLDSVNMPLATDGLSDESADDPVSLPIRARRRHGLGHAGLLSRGECTIAATQTRAYRAAQGDGSLYPLSVIDVPPEQVHQGVETLRTLGARMVEVCRLDDQGHCKGITQGDNTLHTLSDEVDSVATLYHQLIHLQAAAEAARTNVHERVYIAQQVPADLAQRWPGIPRFRTRAETEKIIYAMLTPCLVEDMPHIEILEHVTTRQVCASQGRLLQVRHALTFWPGEHASVERMVDASDNASGMKRTFTRPTGRSLSLAHVSVQGDDQRVSLMHILTVLVVSNPGFTRRQRALFSPLPQQMLALCRFSSALSLYLANASCNRSPIAANGKLLHVNYRMLNVLSGKGCSVERDL